MINCVAYLHKLILLPYRYIPYVINIHNGTQFINMHHPSTPRPPMTTNAYVINIHNGTQFINMQFTLPRHAHRWQRMYAHRWHVNKAAACFNVDTGNLLNRSVNSFSPKNVCQRIYYTSEENMSTEYRDRKSIINYNLDRAGNNIKCSMLCLTKILLTLMRSICTYSK